MGAVLHMEDLHGRSCLDRDGIYTSTEMVRVELAQGKTLACQQGNRTIEEYTYVITKRESQHMGHLA